MKKYSHCQSCGMPFRKDPAGGGTHADGSLSVMYCSHCYENGKFTWPDISRTEMQARVKAKMKGLGFPCFIAVFFAKRIPKLARWNQQQSQ
ncbi:MAG: hypothetical protein CRN43_05410 [Candidatus Nephrothrix sp. EaCA]|nr:MAG: hypothetical protein CRN43_05410 [Candidatus Nephrothrix sp. EaCA]